MSIPSVALITWELLCLLRHAPSRGMKVNRVYEALAKEFPELADEELTVPYASDKYGSKWKTTVRSVREKCKQEGFISKSSDRGYWQLTDKGRKVVSEPLYIPGLGSAVNAC